MCVTEAVLLIEEMNLTETSLLSELIRLQAEEHLEVHAADILGFEPQLDSHFLGVEISKRSGDWHRERKVLIRLQVPFAIAVLRYLLVASLALQAVGGRGAAVAIVLAAFAGPGGCVSEKGVYAF